MIAFLASIVALCLFVWLCVFYPWIAVAWLIVATLCVQFALRQLRELDREAEQ